jgi:hypothetical protein
MIFLQTNRCCAAADDSKGIPGFWATVLARAELVLSEKDADALTYLTGWQLGGFTAQQMMWVKLFV